ncbi:hypothetical protein [Streptomyces sp. NBC_01497]|uniref:hypothetical protein n=1 Tax=Streptomyces sp. NBC_01497 TaxID=2903885 RepID=UPI002E3554F7|nr:hypothetical protein [Streptomyces sp. NBC_01497]
MIPRLRTSCALAVASLLLAAPAAWADGPGGAHVDTHPAPHASAGLAGRQAGEGRDRPGRPPETDPPGASEEPSEAGDRTARDPSGHEPSAHTSLAHEPPALRPSRPGSARPSTTESEGVAARSPGPSSQDAGRRPQAREIASTPSSSSPPASVATLGAGIMLLGLGFAFLALRLRRR